MTKARMDWKRMELELDGHADYAPAGQDIVCAAVSILTHSLIGALQELEAKYGLAQVEWSGNQAEGSMRIRGRVCWANLSVIRAYFEMAVTGLRMLAEEYPEHIELKEEK